MRLLSICAVLGALTIAACDGGGGGGKPSASGAPAAGQDIGEVVATVNGNPIGAKAFEQVATRATPKDGVSLTLEERKELLDQLVAEEVLYLEALRKGLDRDPKVKKVMVNTLLRDEVYATVRNSDFTDAELEAYYEAHKDEFVVPEKVQIKRILIRVYEERSEEDALALAQRLRGEIVKNPDAFKDLASEHSEDPYKRRGGDLGFVSREGKPGLDQAIVDKAFTLEVGQVSEPFRTTDGYNLLVVASKRERVERTFQQMKGSVLRKVKNDRLKELYEGYVAQLKQGVNVQVNDDKLQAVQIEAQRRAPPMPGVGLTPGLLPGEDGEPMAPQDDVGELDEGGEE